MGFFERLESIDRAIFLFLNGINNPFMDVVMFYISEKLIWLPLYAFLIFLIIKRFKKASILPIAMALVVVALCDQISVQLFKETFMRYRPCHNTELDGLVHLVNGHCGGTYGFVSSHATNTFGIAMYVTLLLFKKWKYIWFMMLWAAIVSYSRIYLGVHYPADVLGGAILGSAIGFLCWLIIAKVKICPFLSLGKSC